MKIEIEIPDFVPPERIIHITAGEERIGYITPHDRSVFVKMSRCSRCGLCCRKLGCENWKDKCVLKDRYFYCCVTEPRNISECTSRYKGI